MNCRCYQNALTEFIGLRENCVTYVITYCSVKKIILSAALYDVNLLFANHVVEYVCINAGSINYISCLVFAVVGAEIPETVFSLGDLLNAGVEAEVYAVNIGILCHGDVKFKWADDSGCLCIKSTLNVIGKVRLHCESFFSAQKLHARNTILNALIIELLKSRKHFLMHTYNQ